MPLAISANGHWVGGQGVEFTVGIGGTADLDGRAVSAEPDADDPQRTSARPKSGTAAGP
jgi:hypothetical protein